MEFGGFGDGVLVIVQRAASLGDGGVEIVDGLEMFVDQRLIDEGPQVLGRLQFGRVRREEYQMEALRHRKQRAGVVAGLIAHEHNALGRASAHRGSEGLPGDAHHGGVDRRGELPGAEAGWTKAST